MSSIDPLAGLRPLAAWPKPPQTAPQPVAQTQSFPSTVIEWKFGVLTTSSITSVSAYLAAANARAYSPGAVVQATV